MRWILLIIFIWFYSCYEKNQNDYFPLKVGSKWEYNVTESLPNGNLRNYRQITRIEGTEIINGERYYKLVRFYTGVPESRTGIYFTRKSKEGEILNYEKGMGNIEYVYMILPPTIGSNWTTSTPTGDVYCKVEGVETLYLLDRTIEDCYKISFTGSDKSNSINGYYYLSKGIGIVKQVFKNGQVSTETTLDKYQY